MKFLDGIDFGTLYHFQRNNIPVFDMLCPWLAQMGGYPFLVCCVLFGAIILRLQGRIRALLFLVATFLASAILAEFLKLAICRTRPPDWQGSTWEGCSFPSNEAMVSAVVFLGIAFLYGARWGRVLPQVGVLLVALLLIAAVGFSEIYLRRHFLTDVLGGWIGAAIVLVGAAWISSLAREQAT